MVMDAKGYLNVSDLRKNLEGRIFAKYQACIEKRTRSAQNKYQETARVNGIEKSQSYISEKYESVLKTL